MIYASDLCSQSAQVPLTQWRGDVADLADGFCIDNFYFPSVISRQFWYEAPPTHLTTRFLYQSPGVIDWTARERNLTMEGVEGFVAMYSPATLGWKMWIRQNGDAAWMPVRQADTAAQYHAQYHVGILRSGFEVSWEIAEAWGIPDMNDDPRGLYLWDGEICIAESDPDTICAGDPTDLVEWFTENARYFQ